MGTEPLKYLLNPETRAEAIENIVDTYESACSERCGGPDQDHMNECLKVLELLGVSREEIKDEWFWWNNRGK